jgi:hypothetical protein
MHIYIYIYTYIYIYMHTFYTHTHTHTHTSFQHPPQKKTQKLADWHSERARYRECPAGTHKKKNKKKHAEKLAYRECPAGTHTKKKKKQAEKLADWHSERGRFRESPAGTPLGGSLSGSLERYAYASEVARPSEVRLNIRPHTRIPYLRRPSDMPTRLRSLGLRYGIRV